MHDTLAITAVEADEPPLVIDLDRTLLRTDLLYESFFAALSQSPRAILDAASGLSRGRAALKAALVDRAEIDPASLPYNEAVVALAREARAQGRRVMLVSASDARLVSAVAGHLGLFDEAHGSDGRRNLGGSQKAAFLVERFGRGGFDYVGDAWTDLEVWRTAREAVTVGAAPKLRKAAAAAAGAVRHIEPSEGGIASLKPYLKAMRPHQWLKNVLIFLPLLAAHQFSLDAWTAAVLAFVAFSLTASSVYILNDLLDLSADRAHPRKRRRPFASGAAGVAEGALLAAGLLVAAAALVALVGSTRFAAVLVVYYALTLAYSLSLKRKLVVDICALAGLYSLRAVAGAAAAAIPLSPWLLGFMGFLFFSLAAMKRQTEVVDGARSGRERAAGRAYYAEDMHIVATMTIAAGYIATLVFALYISSAGTARLYPTEAVLWGVCPVLLYWISRMAMLSHRGVMPDDPVVFAVTDRISLACGVLVAALLVAASIDWGIASPFA